MNPNLQSKHASHGPIGLLEIRGTTPRSFLNDHFIIHSHTQEKTRMIYSKLTLVAAALAIALPTYAQQASPDQAHKPPPSPEQVQQLMQSSMRATMGTMVEIMGPMTEAALNAQITIAAKPETAERLAVFKKNLFDALVKKGFTQSQALQIVIATNPPTASMAAK